MGGWHYVQLQLLYAKTGSKIRKVRKWDGKHFDS